MKKKIVGILVCTLLITTALPAIGTLNEKTMTSTPRLEYVPVIEFINYNGINLRTIPLALVNTGDGTAEDMTWKMEILDRGLFQGQLFYPKEDSDIIGSMSPGSDYGTKIRLSGLGITTIRFTCKYKIEELSGCDVEFEVERELRDFSLFSLHIFPECLQPEPEWVDIDNFTYYNEADAAGVQFYVGGVLEMHNVRVVLGLDSNTDEVEFMAACKFIDGVGRLDECWITKEIVEGGDAHWELELLDGK